VQIYLYVRQRQKYGSARANYICTASRRRRWVREDGKHFALGWVGVMLLAFALGGEGSSVQAQIITVGFECISPGASSENAATGEFQLWLDVTHHAGDPTATFRFYNVGSQPCSITDIYIQDGHLTSLLYIVDLDDPPGGPYGDPGVDFSIGATPGHLPDEQYAEPPFVATKQFNMDSDPPVQPWGVNPSEYLVAVYSVQQGCTIYDIEQEILRGELRVGYHIQGFSDGGSASFVNTPEPASLLLLALGTLVFLKKCKNKH
jgi:hypothetical protein